MDRQISIRSIPGDHPVLDTEHGERRDLVVGRHKRPVCAPLAQDLAPEGLVAVAPHHVLLTKGRFQAAVFHQEHGRQVGVRRQAVEVGLDGAPELGFGREIRLDDGLKVVDQLVERLIEDCRQDLLLSRDVVIEAGLLEPDGVGDVLHRGAVITLLPEDLGGGLDDVGLVHTSLPTGR
jgi:hypothetical protein